MPGRRAGTPAESDSEPSGIPPPDRGVNAEVEFPVSGPSVHKPDRSWETPPMADAGRMSGKSPSRGAARQRSGYRKEVIGPRGSQGARLAG
jgi:hypothetical protein